MERMDMQLTVNGGANFNGATTITGALTQVGAVGITGALTQVGAVGITGNMALDGIMRLVAQSEELGGAASVTVASSLIIFTDADTPADSDITLSTTGHVAGQILYVLNKSATDANCVLLAASLVGANPITLASANDFTVLMFDGTSWLNIGGTAPA